MSSFLEIAWLIPAIPFLGAAFVGILLFSFNRTMNRLTKPISWTLILCIALSTLISLGIYLKHYEGESFNYDLNISSFEFHLELYINTFVSLVSTVCGFVMSLVMICSYFILQRKKGYVRYFVLLSVLFGMIFSFILSGYPFLRFFSLG